MSSISFSTKTKSSNGAKLTVPDSTTVNDAIGIIEVNSIQTAFIVDENQILLGIITNGDIRRFLLAGGNIHDRVEFALNRNFKFVRAEAPREECLKLFDLGYSVVPRLDDDGRLIELLTPNSQQNFALTDKVVVRSRAPARLSFAGGGTDLTYHFSKLTGFVLNAAIARYAMTTLIPRETADIDIYSHDLGTHRHFSSPRAMFEEVQQDLITTTVSLIKPEFGFELYIASEFPIGSGLGGSSAVVVSILSAFNEFLANRWSAYEIAELAFEAERIRFKISGGWQDQYASTFGGFNLIEFTADRNNVNSLRVNEDIICELEQSLILFDTGYDHNSGDLHATQKQQMNNANGEEKLKQLSEFCLKMNRALARHELKKFGEGLHQAWLLKKETSSQITNIWIDSIYNAATEAGALGGKLLGAGRGGHMLFFIPPEFRSRVVGALQPFGCKPDIIRFDTKGAHAWRVKL